MNLSGLEDLGELATKKKFTPSTLDTIMYLFWEKGIDETRFNELSIPYILQVLQVHNYVKEQEQKEMNKSKKGSGTI